jgi:hypothetical protein
LDFLGRKIRKKVTQKRDVPCDDANFVLFLPLYRKETLMQWVTATGPNKEKPKLLGYKNRNITHEKLTKLSNI